MRHRRQQLYREPEPAPTPLRSSGPPISWNDVHRDVCVLWRPRTSTTTVTDSKGREWRIADRTGLDAFSREVPVGSRDAGYRTFWRDDHVRAIAFHGDDDDHSVGRDALMTQLRRSWRIDHLEAPLVSKSERFQQLYDRRGMGRR